MRFFAVLSLVLLALSVSFIQARELREGECEICLSAIDRLKVAVKGEKKVEKIEDGIRKECKKWTSPSDKRFCYYIGGSEDAATSMLRVLSPKLLNQFPTPKICEQLRDKDGEICAIKTGKPEVPVDYSKVDFDKLPLKELRSVLTKWGVKCSGCTEKSDFLRLVKQELPKHLEDHKQQPKDKKDL